MNATRFLRHVFATRWSTRRRFSPKVLGAIETAIRETEAGHAGEIRFAVETALDMAELVEDLSPRRRAMQVFGQLGVWDTAHNNGVLIYLLLADHDFEIVADRGIDASVGRDGWEKICQQMEADFRAGDFESGVIKGVEAVSHELATHFPRSGAGPNELPDAPVVM